MPFDREQPFLLPPDLKDWLPEDDMAHFMVAAVERVRLGAFQHQRAAGGKPQYHPRLMLALLVYSYANGIFSSRRIERATYRDIGMRFIAANTHPDHDTIASFRRTNKAAFEAAFLQVLLAGARERSAAARHGVDRRHQDRRQRLEDPLGALRPGARHCARSLPPTSPP